MRGRIKNYIKYFYDGIIDMLKQFFNRDTNKKQRANMWTFLRLIVILPIIILGTLTVFYKSLIMLILGCVCILIGGVSDMMDGKSARKWNSVTEFGIKFDQLVDKLFSITLLIFLALCNKWFIIILLLECIIAGVNTYYFSVKNIKAKSNFIGKIKQSLLFIDMGLGFINIYFDQLSLIVFYLNILVTITQLVTLVKYIYDDERFLNLNNKKCH